MDISVIAPLYNEELNIPVIYERLTKVLGSISNSYEILFINDGSKDRSLSLVKELSAKDQHVKYIDFSRNFGHQIAVSAGLDHVQGEAVVIIDSDLQDPPELIAEMYAKFKQGYEVVYAKRRNRKGEGAFKKLTASVFYRLLSKMTSIDIPLDTGDFRIMDRKIVEVLKAMPEKDKFIRGQVSWAGFNQSFVEYDRDERMAGETGYPLRKMMKFAMDGITGFSNVPLKIVSWFGFMVSIFAFLTIIYTLISKYVLNNAVLGWSSVMISVLFIGGIQLIAIGIIGEYLARMNANIRDRPLYVIKESNVHQKS